MKKEKSKNAGITLIAMIITIIVMLVLAGVSMNAIIGENGILNQAIVAKEETEESALLEKINTIIVQAYAEIGESIETQEEIRGYISEKFASEDISDVALIQNDEEGYVIVYGIYSKNIMYLDSQLNNYWTLEAVIGTVDNWYYKVDETTQKALLTGFNYDNLGSELTIPNVIDGYLVSGLGDKVFMGRTKITSVTFSEGLRTIGNQAFANCTGLTTISDWPSTLTSIGDEAFYGCTNLSMALTFTDNITSVGASAFYNCSSITGTVSNLLRRGVTYGLNAFSGCSGITGDVTEAMNVLIGDSGIEIADNLFSGMSGLTGTVTIGSNIVRIGEYAFYNCTGITKIDISSATNLEIIDDYAFYSCENMAGTLNFEDGMLTVGNYTFCGCISISELTLPSSLSSVDVSSFINLSGLETLVISCGNVFPNSGLWNCGIVSGASSLQQVIFSSECKLTSLPVGAFRNCSQLTSVVLPNGVTKIPSNCFVNCSALVSVNFGSSIVSIDSSAFNGCTSLTTLPVDSEGKLISSLIKIDSSAFYNCSVLGKTSSDETTDIISLFEGSYVTTLGDNAFYGCEYLSGKITDGKIKNASSTEDNEVCISIGASCFYGTSITSQKTFTLASSTKIDDKEFQETTEFVNENGETIETIEIPEGVETIGNYAFSGCTSIKEVIIPSTVISIGNYAFYNCVALVIVKNNSDVLSSIGSNAFAYCTALEDVGSHPGLKTIGDNAFIYCESLESFDFNEGLTSVGAFSYSGISEVVLPSSISGSFGYKGFVGCSSLKSFDMSNSQITDLANFAFSGCSLLSSVNLYNGCLETIGSQTFSGCTSLLEIYVPDSVTSIGDSAFNTCRNLVKITGMSGVVSLDSSCFISCSQLSTVGDLSGVTEIPAYCFKNCKSLTLSGLTSLNWSNLTSIGDESFYNCTSLSGTISLSETCSVSSSAFTNCSLEYEIGY